MLEHGGALMAAARRYGRAPEDWVDLSTGVSPFAWPVGEVPAQAWHRLPEDDDGLLEVARAFYGTASVVAAAGSQAALACLPLLRPPSRVAVVGPTYAEHAHAWRRAGHRVNEVEAEDLAARCDGFDVVVVCNPDNPTARTLARSTLARCHAQLATRAGWLVVDEAFADADGAHSLAADCGRAGLIVLRSPGKFFGLAGMRLGFALVPAALVVPLREALGAWPVSGPARWVGRNALADTAWQAGARARLEAAAARLAALLAEHGLPVAGRTALFAWVATAQGAALAHFLAQRGLLVRAFERPAGVRFGLPGASHEWERLAGALAAWRSAHA